MRTFAILGSFLLAACTAPESMPQPAPQPPDSELPRPAGLHFHVEPRVAAPGSTVTLVLENRTAGEVGYNLCGSPLERWEAGAWRPVPLGGVCTRELRILPPGRDARYPQQLPADLPTGDYRFRTGVEVERNKAGLDPIFSAPFTVRR